MPVSEYYLLVIKFWRDHWRPVRVKALIMSYGVIFSGEYCKCFLDNLAYCPVKFKQLAMLSTLLVLAPVILLLVIEKPLLFGTAAVRSTRR